jgi:short-subunit dehydrogenase
MSYLSGKIIWITGASSGIGEALTYELAKRGAKLILSARRKEELERVKGNCAGNAQPYIRVLPLDLSQAETLMLSTQAATQIFGHIDILINNGGISQRSLAKDTLVEVDRKIMEVDYFGAIALTKYLLPHFIQRKSGHYVTITSVAGKIGVPVRTGYSAAKHALHGFFDSLRAEVWTDHILVTLVVPGWVSTNLSRHAVVGDGSEHNKVDPNNAGGYTPEAFAKKMCNGIEKKKEEIYIAGAKEKLGIYLKRFVPGLFSSIIKKQMK